jgi:2-keto-4-pentenoate hydratase/2-oxohepta-3-ene-1,7-dioic acid hydratase in catechol pathway
VVRATAIADALFPQSTRGFLEGGVATQEMLAKMSEGLTAGTFEPVTAPAAEVRVHAPIHDPGKFICIGLNYTDHAAETGNPTPAEPPVFPKWNTALKSEVSPPCCGVKLVKTGGPYHGPLVHMYTNCNQLQTPIN